MFFLFCDSIYDEVIWVLPLYENKDVAKKFKKLKVRGKAERISLYGWAAILVGIIVARSAGYLKQIVSDIASIINAGIVILGIGGRQITERNEPHVGRLARDIEKATNQNCSISSLDDVEIIPTKIQVGENLEAVNIIPIYENGYYLVLKSRPAAFVLRQLEENGKNNVQILEPEEANEVIADLAVDNEFVRKNIKVLRRSIEQKNEE